MDYSKDDIKKILIDKLFNEFDKNKDAIRKNLLQVMGTIYIVTKDDNTKQKITLTIKYEGDDNNEYCDNL